MPDFERAGPIFIAGPTASGKTEFSLGLARELGGEIISVDSMQVYRGMDIGTAKASKEERREVPHHLIDIVPVSHPFDVAEFVEFARQAQNDIEARGKVPIYCGGTGLYFKALISGIGSAPPADPQLRKDLEVHPLPELLRELEEKDPDTFASIDRNNRRRVVRALEVIRLTGRKFSAQKSDWQQTKPMGHWIGLERERSDLVCRIDARVERMFANGLVEETRELLKEGLRENPTAMQALGYRQVVDYLDGKMSLDQTIELVKVRTRQFAKRQMTWFRHQLDLQWIKVGVANLPSIAEISRLPGSR